MSKLIELLPLMTDGETAHFRRSSSTDSDARQLEVNARDVLVWDKDRALFTIERTYGMPHDWHIAFELDAYDWVWVRCG